MSLTKLRTVPIVLIEDDIDKNVVPLILEVIQNDQNIVNIFAYEQPVRLWRNVFEDRPNVNYYEEFILDKFDFYVNSKCRVIIDSINQMSLCMGWHECLKYLKLLRDSKNVERLIIILHKDCLTHASKLYINLNHIANAIVSFDYKNHSKIWIKIKKGNKVIKSEEILSYDTKTSTLKSIPFIKEVIKDDGPQKPDLGNLSTFKIEVEQTEKLEKYKLKLPYMSKIHEGESKVYYEPDAVDDWDEEDPDDDLDI